MFIQAEGYGWGVAQIVTTRFCPLSKHLHSSERVVERVLIRICPEFFFGAAHHQ